MLQENQIISILGGTESLGHSVKGAMDLVDVIEKGIPWEAVLHVKSLFMLTDREFAETLGMSQRTLSRKRKAAERLTPVASDRLYRMARIFALAKDVLEDEKRAMTWLRQQQVGLGGRTPLELMHTEAGAREVEDLLGRIEYGVLS